MLNGEVLDVANALRAKNRYTRSMKPDFRCVECGKPVRPHSAGGHGDAHFEHLERNPACSLSDPL